MIDCNIIASGSSGNAVILEKQILIDCGVPFKALQPFYKDLSLVLLTHVHSDHFNRATIRRLASERPTLRFGCCAWLVHELFKCGVEAKQIDVYNPTPNMFYTYQHGNSVVKILPNFLLHDVPNVGYKVWFKRSETKYEKVFYATDCKRIDYDAYDYDLYLIEGNYDEDEIDQRITDKALDGEFVYEIRAKENHLSKQKAMNYILKNATEKSRYILMHQHNEKGANYSESSNTDGQADERSRDQEDNDR